MNFEGLNGNGSRSVLGRAGRAIWNSLTEKPEPDYPQSELAPAWQVEEHDAVASTMTLARARPAWTAVLAEEQTAGRGQAQRSFVSDRGGVYLTAVLPYSGDALASRGFALAVGWAIRAALIELGVREVRLKWPNDLMIGCGKVGGILVEQGTRDTVLVGVGLNVTNRPWRTAPQLAGIAGTLSEAAESGANSLPERKEIAAALLRAIARAHTEFGRSGLTGMVSQLNECWGGARKVELALTRGQPLLRGEFLGVAECGGLRVAVNEGSSVVIAAHHVDRLREI